MLPYWLLFGVAVWMSASHMQPSRRFHRHWPAQWWGVFGIVVMMVGMRHEVGADWVAYLGYLDRGHTDSLVEALASKDPAYGLLNWMVAGLGGNIYAVNTVCALIFAWGLISFCRMQPRPWLALVVAIPYLVIVVAMGYTRQGTAIGLVLLGLVALARGNTLHFVLWVIAAATFHKSAVIVVPLAAIAASERRVWTITWVLLAGGALFVLVLQESLDALSAIYIEREYQSQGAGVRIAMNALPAVVFLLLRPRFALLPRQRTFWTWMSGTALALIILLAVSPSSAAVDRLALYWIPLQLFVWSRLPNALGRPDGINAGWVWVVMAYSAAVLFVWLVFGSFSYTWLPYRWYGIEQLLGNA